VSIEKGSCIVSIEKGGIKSVIFSVCLSTWSFVSVKLHQVDNDWAGVPFASSHPCESASPSLFLGVLVLLFEVLFDVCLVAFLDVLHLSLCGLSE